VAGEVAERRFGVDERFVDGGAAGAELVVLVRSSFGSPTTGLSPPLPLPEMRLFDKKGWAASRSEDDQLLHDVVQMRMLSLPFQNHVLSLVVGYAVVEAHARAVHEGVVDDGHVRRCIELHAPFLKPETTLLAISTLLEIMFSTPA